MNHRSRGNDDDVIAAAQREWLKQLAAGTGVSLTRLAKLSGVDPSTLSKFINAKKPGHQLSAKTIARIEATFGKSFAGSAMAVPFTADRHSSAVAMRAAHAAAGPGPLNLWQVQDSGLLAGDILVVDQSVAPRAGDVVVLADGRLAQIKGVVIASVRARQKAA